MKIKDKDCRVEVWTEVHFKMIHMPTGISVHYKDSVFPQIKKVMFKDLKKKMKSKS